MAYVTFTVRIPRQMRQTLTDLAMSENQSVAALSRQILSDGVRRHLEQEKIDARLDAKRAQWLAAAETIRRRKGMGR